MQEDAAAWGLAVDQRFLEPEHYDVWHQHAAALDVFLAASRQWRIVTHMKGVFYQGLDLPAVAAAMEMYGVEDKRTCLQQVQLIEQGALEVMNAPR